MLLIISDGGNLARETSRILDKLDANYLFHFSSFSNAGFFGKGNAVVGKMSYRSLCRIIDKNNINCVVDIINAPKSDESLVALNVAEDLKLPLIKLIPPTLPFERSNLKKVNIKCDVDYSYESVASKINNTVGNIVFFSKPYNVKAISDLVFDRNSLYVPISSGFDFDVELALEFVIPLLNVKDFDDISSFDGMKGVLKKLEAKLLITDSSFDILDKLKAASELGVNVIFTQNSGYDYKYIYDNLDEFSSILKELFVLDSEENISDYEYKENINKSQLLNKSDALSDSSEHQK